MSSLRSAWRLLKLIALLFSMAVDLLTRPSRDIVDGAERIHRHCRRIVHALGVDWRVLGNLPDTGAVVSNHLSYIDILLFSAVRPFVMVAKAEVRRWPVIGWITAQAGTVYVVRGGGPPTWPGVNRAMAEAYRSGLPVLFFPEGTTTDGAEVLPFRRGLFHSVLNEGVALRPAAISYTLDELDRRDGATVANDVCWWGDALLAPHLFRLTGLRGRICAEVQFGEAVMNRRDRFELSETARDHVAQMFDELSHGSVGAPAEAHEPELVDAVS